jgi:transaldolase
MNVFCLGGKVIGSALAWELIQTFLAAHFSGALRHKRRQAKVQALVDCEEVLTRLAKAGIDIDALAAQFQDEGARGFVKSWKELMACMASKREALK